MTASVVDGWRRGQRELGGIKACAHEEALEQQIADAHAVRHARGVPDEADYGVRHTSHRDVHAFETSLVDVRQGQEELERDIQVEAADGGPDVRIVFGGRVVHHELIEEPLSVASRWQAAALAGLLADGPPDPADGQLLRPYTFAPSVPPWLPSKSKARLGTLQARQTCRENTTMGTRSLRRDDGAARQDHVLRPLAEEPGVALGEERH
eukprot:CAMPEP_0179015428 /NCGR_PEP_ID=MMETSP0796-20121207/2785_1 /TAXON_ID=73915 /ORGANISM="Pyrodinium bahamense, Strain pbaha01" /LENGTH=208 /DNA_ID=CAMNT_0020711059 /DNA_START=48 /DNA_END=672 /DNA_ORIENTATION=+